MSTSSPLLIVGLIGGVCAGKSAVAKALEQRGARVWDADKAVREIQSRPDIIKRIATALGDDCVALDGSLNRNAVAKIVFSHPEKLKVLTEDIIWPETSKEIRNEIKRAKADGAHILILDAPTLMESGQISVCCAVVFVTANEEVKARRAAETRGWDTTEVKKRESRMIPEAEKRKRADVVIDNSGDERALAAQVNALWDFLMRKLECRT